MWKLSNTCQWIKEAPSVEHDPGVSMAHFAVALVIVVIAPCGVQRTVRFDVQWQGVSAGRITPAIGKFGGSPQKTF